MIRKVFLLFTASIFASAAYADFVYYTQSTKVSKVSVPNTGSTDCVISSLTQVASVAIDLDSEKAYFSDEGDDKIYKTDLNCGTPTVFLSNLLSPGALSIDAVNRKLYWSGGSGSQEVNRVDLDSSDPNNNIETFINTATSVIHGIRVDGANNMVYFIDGIVGGIYQLSTSSLMNFPTSLYVPGVSTKDPIGLAIDVDNGKIYWSNQIEGTIERRNLDGSSISGEIIVNGISAPVGIDLDTQNSKIYWIDQGNHTVNRASISGQNQSVETLFTDLSGVLGDLDFVIKAIPVDETTQPQAPQVTSVAGRTVQLELQEFSADNTDANAELVGDRTVVYTVSFSRQSDNRLQQVSTTSTKLTAQIKKPGTYTVSYTASVGVERSSKQQKSKLKKFKAKKAKFKAQAQATSNSAKKISKLNKAEEFRVKALKESERKYKFTTTTQSSQTTEITVQ